MRRNDPRAAVHETHERASDAVGDRHFFTLRSGLITGMQAFFDTVDTTEQPTGRDLVGPLLAEVGAALRPPALPLSPPLTPVK